MRRLGFTPRNPDWKAQENLSQPGPGVLGVGSYREICYCRSGVNCSLHIWYISCLLILLKSQPVRDFSALVTNLHACGNPTAKAPLLPRLQDLVLAYIVFWAPDIRDTECVIHLVVSFRLNFEKPTFATQEGCETFGFEAVYFIFIILI